MRWVDTKEIHHPPRLEPMRQPPVPNKFWNGCFNAIAMTCGTLAIIVAIVYMLTKHH